MFFTVFPFRKGFWYVGNIFAKAISLIFKCEKLHRHNFVAKELLPYIDLEAIKTKPISTARKRVLRLIKLRSLAVKCCKIRKIQPCEDCKICMYVSGMDKLTMHIWSEIGRRVIGSSVIYMQNLQASQGYVLRITTFHKLHSPRFAILLISKVSFLAVLIDFIFLPRSKFSL